VSGEGAELVGGRSLGEEHGQDGLCACGLEPGGCSYGLEEIGAALTMLEHNTRFNLP